MNCHRCGKSIPYVLEKRRGRLIYNYEAVMDTAEGSRDLVCFTCYNADRGLNTVIPPAVVEMIHSENDADPSSSDPWPEVVV